MILSGQWFDEVTACLQGEAVDRLHTYIRSRFGCARHKNCR